MKKSAARMLSGALSAALLVTAIPAASLTAQAEDTTGSIVYSTGFEDGDTSQFTGRGGVEVLSTTTAQAHTGSYSMEVSGRTASWNGPQFLLSGVLEEGEEYTVSAYVKTEWYNTVKLSLDYTDSDGKRHYDNKATAVSNGDWAEFTDIKISLPEDATNVYVYLEGSDTATMYIDDFTITGVAQQGIEEDIPSLKDVYADYFKIGTAVTTSELAPKSAKALILKHFNSITLGNELKPDAILDQEATLATGSNTDPQVNISSARSILNFCRDNNISVRGHVLVWHQQTPDWFFKEGFSDDGDWVSKEVMLERMENYIKNVFAAVTEEYPTVDFYAWDVVNEAWMDDGTVRPAGIQTDSYKNSPWVKVFGDNSFIEYAFTYARKYAPEGCKLYYNDYNEYIPAKTEAICNMVSELKEKGLIDGVGLQSHLDVRSGSDAYPSATMYKTALEKFAALGVDIQVTELDATVNDELYEEQAQYYSDIMDAIVEYKDYISAVVFWGTTDDKSWRSSYNPLLFDSSFAAKPCFYSIIDGIEYDATATTTTTTTTTTEKATETETTTTTTVTTATSSSSGETETYIPGDTNNDQVVNGFDLALMRYVLLTPTDDTVVIDAYDMNQDGSFDISDAVALTKFLLQA